MPPCSKLHLLHANFWVHEDLAVEGEDKRHRSRRPRTRSWWNPMFWSSSLGLLYSSITKYIQSHT